MSTFKELFDQHVGAVMLKQQVLTDFLGDHSWSVDMDAGTIDFGEDRVYPVSVLGTQSDISGTWLWAWANQTGEFPQHTVQLARTVREFGEREGIPELTKAHFTLGAVSGHELTIVACAITNADAYYVGRIDGATEYMLITGSPLAEPQSNSAADIAAILTYVTDYFTVDHKAMTLAMFAGQGYTVTEEDGVLTAVSPSEEQIVVRFDEAGKIAEIESPRPEGEDAADNTAASDAQKENAVFLMYWNDHPIGTVTNVGWIEAPWAGGTIALGRLTEEIRAVLEYVRRESETEHGPHEWPFRPELADHWRIVTPDGNPIAISPPIIDPGTGRAVWR